jgi:ATP-dependent DNA ligase
MIYHWPDDPCPVSLDFLRELDRAPARTWLAQLKWDGYRRTGWLCDGGWVWQAKRSGAAAKAMPAEVMEAWRMMSWPDLPLAIDCEWVGPRKKGGEHRLIAFDILMYEGQWLGRTPFGERSVLLGHTMQHAWLPLKPSGIEWAETIQNPGMVDLYIHGLSNPDVEGVVVRKASSGLKGGLSACLANPEWFKVRYGEGR